MIRVSILDVSSIARRYFHGMPPQVVDGRNVAVVRGFERLLRQFISHRDTTHLVAAFDSDSSVRKAIFSDYKAGREDPPAGYLDQLAMTERLLQWAGVPCVRVDGWEADDIIATLVRRVEGAGDVAVVIHSEDGDLHSLLRTGRVMMEKSTGPFCARNLQERYGVRPDQWLDYRALVGDASDGVPGVPRVGPKTASTLLHEFGSLDGIFANLDTLSEKQRVKFVDGAAGVYGSRELMRLRTLSAVPKMGAAAKITPVDTSEFWSSHVFDPIFA